MNNHWLIWLILGLPLVGVLVNGFLGARLPRSVVAVLGCGVVLGAFGIALFVMQPLVQGEARAVGYLDLVLYEWLGQSRTLTVELPALSVPFGVRLDALSFTMVLVVTGVGFLIHLYSVGYMWDDPGFARYFTYLNLFTFAMLLLVMANNYLLMFVGWEGVGLCSFLLIGFWYEKPAAAFAGKKAFLVNRVGDFGFVLGLLWMFGAFGTFTFSHPGGGGVFDQIAGRPEVFAAGGATLTGIALLLFVGACGKSAQGPLYLWLPDAMEGPTPVSALIHAATMVTAGVYMVARSAAIYSRAPVAETVVVVVGCVTVLFAALVAIVQYDIKRVLAYSTVSQLGYMFIGVGVGAYAAGVFHLVTHAFFKALLFLAAGSVMHALAGELDIRRMGGLARWLPITFGTFICGWLAIAGVWPLAGFFSKDAILHAALAEYPVIAWLGLVGAFLTAFYMTRLYTTTFLGNPSTHFAGTRDPRAAGGQGETGELGNWETAEDGEEEPDRDMTHGPEHGARGGHGGHGGHGTPHESPKSMWIPLAVLAVASAVGGIALSHHLWAGDQFWLQGELAQAFRWADVPAEPHRASIPAAGFAAISLAVALAGIAFAWVLHLRGVFARGWGNGLLVRVVEARFGYDALVHFLFVRVGSVIAELLAGVVDALIIDGAVRGIGRLVEFCGEWLRSLQTGFVRNYALTILAGVAFVLSAMMWAVWLGR